MAPQLSPQPSGPTINYMISATWFNPKDHAIPECLFIKKQSEGKVTLRLSVTRSDEDDRQRGSSICLYLESGVGSYHYLESTPQLK